MTSATEPDCLPHVLRETILSMVRRDEADLTARQLAVLLTVYLKEAPRTVRGLAAELQVSKPAITRALDRLGELDLVRRKIDLLDRRSVNVQQTTAGKARIQELQEVMLSAFLASGTRVAAAA